MDSKDNDFYPDNAREMYERNYERIFQKKKVPVQDLHGRVDGTPESSSETSKEGLNASRND